MKSLKLKSKPIVFAGLLAVFALLVFARQNWSSEVALNNLLSALPSETILKMTDLKSKPLVKAEVYIQLQSEDKMMSERYTFRGYDKTSTQSVPAQLASPYTFMSYVKTSTNPIPIKSNWSVASDVPEGYGASEVQGIHLEKCRASETCTLHTGIYPQKLLLTATNIHGVFGAKVNVTSTLPPNPFKDDVPDWARATVYSLYRRGVLKGYANGTYGSSDPVTRGQAVLMFYNLMLFHELDPGLFLANRSCDGVYSDVKSTHYAAKAICLGSHLGWFKEFVSEQVFNPDEPIKRQEIAQMIYNIITAKGLERFFGFKDTDEINTLQLIAAGIYDDVEAHDRNAKAIGALNALGIMRGSGDHFRPTAPLNRAEIATLIQNVAAYFRDMQ